MSDLAELSATAAAHAIATGEVTSRALTEACLARISAGEPNVQAFAFLDPGYALGQADRADETLRAGRGVGPLHGVPVVVKDIIDTADMPTENGFPALYAGRRPQADAHCVAALRAAGAVVIGKTVSSPLAGPGPIKSRNPHDATRTPGTSSSGSAAAVAAGFAPLGIGTQTAGSVIRPASFCGVVGFKPTFGLVSRRGVKMQSHTLDTIGVLARSVEDAAVLTDCIAGHDAADPDSLSTSRPSLLAAARSEAPVPPLFAFYKSPFWRTAEASTKEAFGELALSLGDRLVEIESPLLDDALQAQQDIMAAENAAHYGALYDEAGAHMSELLRTSIERGRAMPADRYIRALMLREEAYKVLAEHARNHAAILTLASEGVAPLLTAPFTPNVNGIWTLLGGPAVTLPLIEIDGLPVGVQLVGARRDDGRLLRTARWLMTHVQAAA